VSRFFSQEGGRNDRRRDRLVPGAVLAALVLVLALVLWWVLTPEPPPAGGPEPRVDLPLPPETVQGLQPDSLTGPPEIIIVPEQEGDWPVDAPPVRRLAGGFPDSVSTPPASQPREPAMTLGPLDAALLPLVLTPMGIGRRAPAPESRRTAIIRAESLLTARLASLPGTKRANRGAVGLANGGVTVAIPWGGFLPANRRDGKWREERCKGKDAGKADKPGEGRARRARCG
jgi:hypothetical protein